MEGRVKPLAVPAARQLPGLLQRQDCAGRLTPPPAPCLDRLLRTEEQQHPSGEDQVIPAVDRERDVDDLAILRHAAVSAWQRGLSGLVDG